jgi:hypothetical protein
MGTDRGSTITIALYGLVAFAIIFSGAISGLCLARLLPEHYRHDATRRVAQTSMAMVSLLFALVLGHLVAAAKNKFDTSNREVGGFAANLMRLDRELSNYGEEAKEIRPLLKQFALAKFEASWPARGAASVDTVDPPQWRLLENVQRSRP